MPRVAPTYDFAKISQKLHEIERIWTPGGHASLTPPLDPPLVKFTLMDRMDSEPNLSIKRSVTIGTMINFDGDRDGHGDGDGMCNVTFTCTVSMSISVTVTVYIVQMVTDRLMDRLGSKPILVVNVNLAVVETETVPVNRP